MPRELRRPRCYGCRERPARVDSLFCSNRCAADFAEALAQGNGDVWCSVCCEWRGPHELTEEGYCPECGPHPASRLVEWPKSGLCSADEKKT